MGLYVSKKTSKKDFFKKKRNASDAKNFINSIQFEEELWDEEPVCWIRVIKFSNLKIFRIQR